MSVVVILRHLWEEHVTGDRREQNVLRSPTGLHSEFASIVASAGSQLVESEEVLVATKSRTSNHIRLRQPALDRQEDCESDFHSSIRMRNLDDHQSDRFTSKSCPSESQDHFKSHESFAEILTDAKQGDEQALTELYLASQKYLLLIANQELSPQMLQKFGASDVVQQSLVIATDKISDFRGTTKGQFFCWIREILNNECRQTGRRYHGTKKRDANREQSISPGSASGVQRSNGLCDQHLTPSTQAAADEQVELVQIALCRLSELDQQVIRLRNWEELSFEEIGQAIGKSMEASRKTWSRAVERLEKELRNLEAI